MPKIKIQPGSSVPPFPSPGPAPGPAPSQGFRAARRGMRLIPKPPKKTPPLPSPDPITPTPPPSQIRRIPGAPQAFKRGMRIAPPFPRKEPPIIISEPPPPQAAPPQAPPDWYTQAPEWWKKKPNYFRPGYRGRGFNLNLLRPLFRGIRIPGRGQYRDFKKLSNLQKRIKALEEGIPTPYQSTTTPTSPDPSSRPTYSPPVPSTTFGPSMPETAEMPPPDLTPEPPPEKEKGMNPVLKVSIILGIILTAKQIFWS